MTFQDTLAKSRGISFFSIAQIMSFCLPFKISLPLSKSFFQFLGMASSLLSQGLCTDPSSQNTFHLTCLLLSIKCQLTLSYFYHLLQIPIYTSPLVKLFVSLHDLCQVPSQNTSFLFFLHRFITFWNYLLPVHFYIPSLLNCKLHEKTLPTIVVSFAFPNVNTVQVFDLHIFLKQIN